jgi:hypothetical protein
MAKNVAAESRLIIVLFFMLKEILGAVGKIGAEVSNAHWETARFRL